MPQLPQQTHKPALLDPPPAVVATTVRGEGLCLGPLPVPHPGLSPFVLGTFQVNPMVVFGDVAEDNGEDGGGGAGAGHSDGGEENTVGGWW